MRLNAAYPVQTIPFKFIFGLLLFPFLLKAQPTTQTNSTDGARERAYLIGELTRIADPVLQALSKNELKKRMPVEAQEGLEEDRRKYTYLEAIGRLLSGMAPWLELGPDETDEGKLREKYIRLALASIKNATDPNAPDFMNFTEGGQPLVDAAFLAHALIRAPRQLWERLDRATQANVMQALKSTRQIEPYESNWLLFSAMVEAAILKFEGSCEMKPVNYAIDKHMEWYKGDGIYGDGPAFHWDYYNSYVIQPFLIDILQVLIDAGQDRQETYDLVFERAQRYAAVQERLISPVGTYPTLGRSLAYRFGAFQLLSQVALMQSLPQEIAPQQVRAALYTVIKNQLEAAGTFDENGWLQIGLYGHQPGIGERYISTGSLYLCTEAFLILGLPATNPLWQGADKPWTQYSTKSGVAMLFLLTMLLITKNISSYYYINPCIVYHRSYTAPFSPSYFIL